MRAPEWERRMALRQIQREERRKAAARRHHEATKLHAKGLLSIDEQRALWPSEGHSFGRIEQRASG